MFTYKAKSFRLLVTISDMADSSDLTGCHFCIKKNNNIRTALSTRVRIFLNPQLFLSGLNNFPVHT